MRARVRTATARIAGSRSCSRSTSEGTADLPRAFNGAGVIVRDVLHRVIESGQQHRQGRRRLGRADRPRPGSGRRPLGPRGLDNPGSGRSRRSADPSSVRSGRGSPVRPPGPRACRRGGLSISPGTATGPSRARASLASRATCVTVPRVARRMSSGTAARASGPMRPSARADAATDSRIGVGQGDDQVRDRGTSRRADLPERDRGDQPERTVAHRPIAVSPSPVGHVPAVGASRPGRGPSPWRPDRSTRGPRRRTSGREVRVSQGEGQLRHGRTRLGAETRQALHRGDP